MDSELDITLDTEPAAGDLDILRRGYDADTEAAIGEEGRREIACFLRDQAGNVLGGVKGIYSNYGWLWVDLLWISEPYRGQGYGTKLMNQIEGEAAKNGCRNAYLNSFSFQAVEFYRKLGYRVFGQLEDFPRGHQVCSMTKSIGAP